MVKIQILDDNEKDNVSLIEKSLQVDIEYRNV